MGIGHRALFVWVILLLILIFLVVYLDGGLDGEPSIFFVLLWFMDLIGLSAIVTRALRHYQICGNSNRRRYDLKNPQYTASAHAYPLDKRKAVTATSLLLLKLSFEVLLYIRLKFGVVRLLWMMVPFWLFLGLSFGDLTNRLINIHNKPLVKATL